MGHQGEQQWTQYAALRGPSAQGDDTGDIVAHSHGLRSVGKEVKEPVTEGVLKPSGASVLTRCCGMMVLNTELKSRNSIRM